MDTIESKHATSKPRRHWYQYSLRTLMVIVTIFAIFCSFFAVKMQKSMRQRAAVKAIINVGGCILFDYQYDFKAENYRIPGWNRPSAPSPILQFIFGEDLLSDVVYAQFNSTQLTDDQLIKLQLSNLQSLQDIRLSGTQIDDRGLEYLSSIKQLKVLDVTNTKVSNQGVKKLQQELPECKIIH
jgi:hypothetical protein